MSARPILSYADVLAETDERRHLLLGNGFSIACRPDLFRYDKLFDRADFSKLKRAREAFDRLKTTNFEAVIRALRIFASLSDLYALGDGSAGGLGECSSGFAPKSSHPNGNIFFSTQAALDIKITEILRVVDEIQTHSKPVIQRCYYKFLEDNHDPEVREYPDDEDQIREVLIHENYLSQKDIEICAAYDLSPHETQNNFSEIYSLHRSLQQRYASE